MSEIQAYLGQVEAVKADGRALVASLTDRQFNWREAPERWSVGQCLDHLNVSVGKTLPAFDRGIDEARTRGWVGEGPFTYSRFARWMIGSMEPPATRRHRTSKIFVPNAGTDLRVADVLPEFLRVRDELIARLERARGLDLKRARVTSPVSRFFRMSLGGYFGFVIAHERRHLWQARQVMAAPGFPTP